MSGSAEMAYRPIKVLTLDLPASAPPAIEAGRGYAAVRVLLRWRGLPIGYVTVPVGAAPLTFRTAALAPFMPRFLAHALRGALAAAGEAAGEDRRATPGLDALFDEPVAARPRPSVTVAVCTRDRVDSLRTCLAALERVRYHGPLDLLVVDNAPRTDATERLVRDGHPRIRYAREPRPGLDWARNRAIAESTSEILAYTDDDVVVHPGWVTALATLFAGAPDVTAVTGLVVPHELETEAQWLFERYGGFGRGFDRVWYRAADTRALAPEHGLTGKFGTGANMAYRRAVLERLGGFDPALDVGTVTNGGGDLEMFFRVLKAGGTLVYEPRAIVYHRHRRTYAELREQIRNNGIGFYSYLVRTALAYPDERLAVVRLGLWWFWRWSMRRLLLVLLGRAPIPPGLVLAELVGSLVGLTRYPRARRHAARLAAAPGAGGGRRPSEAAS
jgi:O-antigen biosynthesis protein